jgi:hypothetical protein
VFELQEPLAVIASFLEKVRAVSSVALLAHPVPSDDPAAKAAAALPARLKALPVWAGPGLFLSLSAVVVAAGHGRHRFSCHWCLRCG